MKKWQVEPVLIERIEERLNAIEVGQGKIQQILASSNPLNVYVVWFTETAVEKK